MLFRSSKTFSNFLTGQCLEALILGSMFFVAMCLFKMPYALLVGVLVAFTALIPIFGDVLPNETVLLDVKIEWSDAEVGIIEMLLSKRDAPTP